MFIFLSTAGPKLGWWESRSDKLRPTSCRAVKVKLDRRIPANWHTKCESKGKANLFVNIQDSNQKNLEMSKLRPYLYRELANNLILIAKNSPIDNLERTPFVRVQLNHPQLTLNALTEGKFIIKLTTLRDKKLIGEHLKVTVQIQEAKK